MIVAALALSLSLSPNPQIDAARGVLERTIGARAKDFTLQFIRPNTALDTFEIEAKNGKVTVKGTSGVAVCRGAYEYLKSKCHVMVSWEGSNASNLPKTFPDQAPRWGWCPVTYRHYYNICTFGYTTAFWDWKRWRREIDWMALHGINMPLAMTGQDKVWQTVFRSYGVPQASLDKFFSGPAFQPWHWMGNLNGHGGPTPQSWLDGQAELQKKILNGERALGMKPVVPGFSGFVPVDFDKYVSGVRLDSPTAWAGFEPTRFVDVRDPKFIEIGKRFVQENRKEFGTDHLYLCDTFNEQNPQFPEATKLADLRNAGRAVYEGLRAGDPEAIWVMQGWLFYNERDYWKRPEVEALLSGVPDGRMVILDLAAEQFEVWRSQPAVARKGFIYNTLHNFGQNTGLGGDLQTYADRQTEATTMAERVQGNNLRGYGLTPEGIDQNPVVYELMCDAMWQHHTVSFPPGMPKVAVPPWLVGYAEARYGIDLPETGEAWQLLYKAVYSKDSPWYRESWRGRPGRGRRGRPAAQMRLIGEALDQMMKASARLGKNPLFQRDLVDVTKTYLGGLADREVYLATLGFQGNDPETYGGAKRAFFATLDQIDQIMACRLEHRLSTWIGMARSWGRTPAEKRLLERNARLQITAWDGKGVLTDYANKEWAGLTKDFIAQRWRMYFDGLENKTKPDYLAFENRWANSAVPPKESKPGDPVAIIRAALLDHRGELDRLEKALGSIEPPGNLARQGTASDDGHTEPGGSPANAIDGDLDTYWAASPSPCTWQLDLGSPKPIKTIQVFPYWGDGRFYQYVVEVSSDGISWRQVVDMSTNTEPSSMNGHVHRLAQSVSARYVRTKMLKNSANIGVHLVEVRVYG